MKSFINKNKGITLIALIITILVMLILAVVSISAVVGDNGVMTRAKKSGEEQRYATVKDHRDLWWSSLKVANLGKNTSVQTLDELVEDLKVNGVITNEEKEFILENGYVTIAEKNIDFLETLNYPSLGDYIEYDVEYTDMCTGYKFTSTTGWRFLGESDGNFLIISTGIPVKLYYDCNVNAGREKNGWWGTDEEVKEMFGEEYSKNGYTAYPNRYVTVGMLKHFEDIPYTQTTNNPTQNKMTGTVSGKGNTLGKALRSVKLADSIIDVHNLTLEEANKALEKDPDNEYLSSSDVFYINKLTQYGYGGEGPKSYWLATPVKNSNSLIYRIWTEGYIIEASGGFSYMAARPVITLSSEIRFEYNEEGYYEIN